MEFEQVVRTRRSIRRFSDKKIPAEVLERILEAARWAPCAGNIFNTRIVLVEDKGTKAEIASACLEQSWIASAHIILVFCSLTERIRRAYEERGRFYQIQNTGAAVQNVLLAAADKGVASCWVGAFSDNQVRRALKIPDEIEIHAVVPLGYRNEVPLPVRKLHLSDILHWEKWGRAEKSKPKRLLEYVDSIRDKIASKFKKSPRQEFQPEQEPGEEGQKPLSFYDLKAKKKFTSSNYKIVTKKVKGVKRKFAVAQAPSGIESWRILPKG